MHDLVCVVLHLSGRNHEIGMHIHIACRAARETTLLLLNSAVNSRLPEHETNQGATAMFLTTPNVTGSHAGLGSE